MRFFLFCIVDAIDPTERAQAEGGTDMRANINGISLQGTPEEIAQYVWELKQRQMYKYSKEAQQAMFDRQEGKMWQEA